jgi:hypothetical protein
MKSLRDTRNTYSDLLFGSPVGTGQNNCYAYAVDYYRNHGDEKLQPGDLAGIGGGVDLKDCDDLVRRALADGKAMGWDLQYLGAAATNASTECGKGAYKIVAVVAPNDDFHWYRHHKDLLYRVHTPRSLRELAQEFGVPQKNVQLAGGPRADTGDLVLIRGANVWSHKQGFSPDGPLLRDACGKIIKDPRKACRNYGGLNYTKVCGAFCLKKK